MTAIHAGAAIGTRARLALLVVPAGFFGLLFAWPVAAIVGTGLRSAGGWALDDAVGALGDHVDTIGFTLWQAALSTLATFAVALPGAWALARFRFRGRAVFRVLATVPFVLPTVVVATAIRGLAGPQGLLSRWVVLEESLLAIVLAHAFFNYAVVVWVVGDRWAHLDRRIEEAARTLGDRRWAVLRRVTLPLLAPSLLAAGVLVFLFCATSYGVIVLLGGPEHATIEVAIARAGGALFDLPAAAALSILQLAGVAALLWAHGRLRDRQAQHGVQAPEERVVRRASGWQERTALGAVLASMVVFLAVPLAALVERSFRVGDSYGLAWYRGLFESARESTLFVTPWESVRTSVAYAAVAAVIAVLVGTAAAVAVAARRDRIGRAADAVLALPLGVSAVTVGLGLLLALDQPPVDLRGDAALVPLAHAVIGVPFVLRGLVPVLRAVDPRLREAAGVLGAGPWRRLRDIDLALAGRAVLVAAGFAFAISLGEFGATSMVARTDTPTVTVTIGRFLSRPGPASFGLAAAMSVVLLALTATVVLLSQRGRVREFGAF